MCDVHFRWYNSLMKDKNIEFKKKEGNKLIITVFNHTRRYSIITYSI